eukprot:TRINITY_DN32737_c0_g1_i1.p1 TRINITY_DN32737_c0_g1~~TRINITY_DN32737_c0_g1_i1.p1  ORF type:complete len:120 (+),score=17.12 TRINITY_DN32737_c0_g1_i1:25-384(+)
MGSLGVLFYTKNLDNTICFLLWRHSKSTSHQSATYWSDIVCEQSKKDQSTIDTLARASSTVTRGLFVGTKGIEMDDDDDEGDDEEEDERIPRKDRQRIKQIGRAVQQECRDRSRMPSSA